jgi:hypothetical protein
MAPRAGTDVFADGGSATISIDLKDTDDDVAPRRRSQVTFSRYRVEFIRSDGRNHRAWTCRTPSTRAVTMTAAPGAPAALVSSWSAPAKTEAPLVSLATNLQLITMIARGHLLRQGSRRQRCHGRGQLGITFGNFGDPD